MSLFISLFLFISPIFGGNSLSLEEDQGEPSYTYDPVSCWLTVTSGILDLNSISPQPTVIEVSPGVTINNVPSLMYKGVGTGGTLLYPQGGSLSSGRYIESAETYVRYGEISGGTYTISPVGIGTLCFPNTVTIDEPSLRAFKATGVNDGILTLEDATESLGDYIRIPANTPVILYKAGGGRVELGSTGEVSHAPVTISQDHNLLVGINNTMTVNAESGFSHYLMQSHEGIVGFYPAVDAEGRQRSFKATQYRCFLSLPETATAKSISFSIPGGVHTGIDKREASGVLPDGLYDLSGKVVQKPRSGQIYIICLNGKTTKAVIHTP